MERFMLADTKNLRAAVAVWVRGTMQQALDATLAAGNPPHYRVGINGTTGTGGKVRQGFRPGAIAQAETSARVEFIAQPLADIANSLKPILLRTIGQTFPNSPRRVLRRQWSWWVKRKGNTNSEHLGATVPATIGMEDVLWLVPDADPAEYAWFANWSVIHERRAKYNFRKRKDGTGIKRNRQVIGFLAKATKTMRARRYPAVTIQGGWVKHHMTGPHSRANDPGYGVPAVRVAFKKLKRALNG